MIGTAQYSSIVKSRQTTVWLNTNSNVDLEQFGMRLSRVVTILLKCQLASTLEITTINTQNHTATPK
jgi:hypothetical protein